jgi:hypothetical protein
MFITPKMPLQAYEGKFFDWIYPEYYVKAIIKDSKGVSNTVSVKLNGWKN